MTDEIELLDYEYDEIADAIPKHPPLTVGGGDASVKDMYPDLTTEELDRVYEIYKRNGGTMRKG